MTFTVWGTHVAVALTALLVAVVWLAYLAAGRDDRNARQGVAIIGAIMVALFWAGFALGRWQP